MIILEERILPFQVRQFHSQRSNNPFIRQKTNPFAD